MAHPRLDEWLVETGHYKTRARARDAINRGCVSVGDEVSAKPSRRVTDPSLVSINDPAQRYVSRAALKLKHAIEATDYSPKDKTALDLGASTGGFCQVMLEHDVSHIYAVDVGHDQMDDMLVSHNRITNLEGVNARDLTLEHLDNIVPDFITSDLSFISLKLALPPALELAGDPAIGIFLVKPQFEVGRDNLGRGGIVRDPEMANAVATDMKHWLNSINGWQTTHLVTSPIHGGDGNVEFLLAGVKNAGS